jgi:eukaryotic-like serine/threonine-protein kinase
VGRAVFPTLYATPTFEHPFRCVVTADLRSQLQASLGGYSIERELGGGGMARVFTAVETALGRTVVIKVLSPELAAEVSSRRFAREIRLVASLQQANIVPVLASGETNGLPYYTMPFVEGLSLRDRLDTGGPFSIPEAVGVLRDVARALAYAHEHGVVHRDIKPDNILLSGDAAVVADFGIAKAISDARTADDSERPATVTQAGTAIGTPAYMAPEQIAADPDIDHRADLYAFGCVAYELLAGEAPFASRQGHQMLAHVSERPVPVAEKRLDCPAVMAQLVMRCLEKDPAARPQSAREILRVMDETTTGGGSSPLFRRLTRPYATVALVALGVALVVAGLTARDGTARELSVAVLPFSTFGGDSAQQYIAEGLADELATALGKVPGIRVVSRTLSYRYSGRDVDAAAVGRTLTADYVLHGNVRRAGDRLRVSAQLTSADDNSEYWSDNYSRDSRNVFEMQDEITREIAAALRARLGRGAADTTGVVTARSGTTDLEAYDLYLRGRFLLARRGPAVRQSVERFEQAIARDNNFARAHAGLAVALELLPYFADVRAQDVRERAIASARRALAIDSTLSEAYTALGLAHQHAYEWALAEQAHRRAVELDPNDASARVQYGRFLHYTGRLTAALAEFERARFLDPYSAVASGWFAHLLDLSGRRREGIAEYGRALEIDSVNPPALFGAALAHFEQGDTAKAKELTVRLASHVPAWRVPAAQLQARMGSSEPALRMVREIERGRGTGAREPPGGLLMLLVVLPDTAATLTEMERATAAGDLWPTYVSLSERVFDSLRRSPRFAAVVRRVGLDERIFTSPTGGRPR